MHSQLHVFVQVAPKTVSISQHLRPMSLENVGTVQSFLPPRISSRVFGSMEKHGSRHVSSLSSQNITVKTLYKKMGENLVYWGFKQLNGLDSLPFFWVVLFTNVEKKEFEISAERFLRAQQLR
ncbi:hypothetical protein CEXT_703421 [Caerostris extrusa]|uniref:Uncharacterized protein n=1 Tax=Caerostris extrusa TaxID=172846 RepID=A0AAV4NKS2_CAEEX|nr:hypothetical protein CEXT_703421 [Caerostris extrusa]